MKLQLIIIRISRNCTLNLVPQINQWSLITLWFRLNSEENDKEDEEDNDIGKKKYCNDGDDYEMK